MARRGSATIKTIGNLSDAAADRMIEALRAVDEEVRAILKRIDPRKVSERDKVALRNLAEARAEILRVVKREGASLSSSIMEDAAAEAAAKIGATLDIGEFNAQTSVEIDRILRGQDKEITKVFGAGARDMERAISAGSLSTPEALRKVTEDLERSLRTSFVRAGIAVESSIAATARTVTVDGAESAADDLGMSLVYEYVGPFDSVNRPFCKAHVSRPGRRVAYTRDAFDKLRNDDQDLGANSVWGGGYGCRHILAPLTIEEARDEGLRIVGARA